MMDIDQEDIQHLVGTLQTTNDITAINILQRLLESYVKLKRQSELGENYRRLYNDLLLRYAELGVECQRLKNT
jgi:hypothetical protein